MNLINLEAERALIGSVLINPSCWHEVEHVSADDFHRLEHRAIWSAFGKLVANSQPIDIVTVERESKVPVYELSEAIFKETVTSLYAVEYAGAVKDSAILRRIHEAATSMVNAAIKPGARPLDVLSLSEKKIEAIKDHVPTADVEHVSDVLSGHADLVTGGTSVGVYPMVSKELNRMFGGGLWQSEAGLIVGERKLGKSILLEWMAKQLGIVSLRLPVDDQYAILYVSLEMNKRDYATRAISEHASIPEELLRRSSAKGYEQEYTNALAELSELPIYITERSEWPIDELRNTVRRYYKEHKVRIVLIDYLGLLGSVPGIEKEEYKQLAAKADQIKKLAKDMNVAVVAIHTVNVDGTVKGGTNSQYPVDYAFSLMSDKTFRETHQDPAFLAQIGGDQDRVWLKELFRRYGGGQSPVALMKAFDLPKLSEAHLPHLVSVAERTK